MGPFGLVGPRRKVEATVAPFQWPGGADRFGSQKNASSRLPLRMINVIFAAPSRIGSCPSRVMFVAWLSTEDNNSEPKRDKIEIQPILSFSDKDKTKIIQPHDDALVVTLKI